ncbi:MAG TPA: DUF192 domain-containing protein [Spirochaetales bacterium]|nr:DUF192 domain-containing protein [Spirochaetales bacterium]
MVAWPRTERYSVRRMLTLLVYSLVLAIGLSSCQAKDTQATALPPAKAQGRLETAVLRSGSVSVEAELARTDAQQTAGLMFRTELADGQGMLFVYDRDRIMSFWMKNTLIPLSIAYLAADGTIREIFNMEPQSLEAINGTRYARYALEVPQGWFDRVGLKPGDRFELPGNL